MKKNKYIEEEITLFELSKRFLLNDDMETPEIFDIDGVEVETLDNNGKKCFRKINKFVVKPSVDKYYSDGNINVSSNHRFIVDGKEVFAHELPQFNLINQPLNIVDIEVEDLHSYLANGYLNHNTTTGGTAIPFTASVRLRFKKMGQIKGKINGMDNAIGERIQVQIVKNRVGPPRRKVTFDVRYDSGIDNYGSWLTCLKEMGAINQSGSSYTYKYVDVETGEEITRKFQSKDFKKLLEENPGLKQVIYQQICDEYIMKYSIGDDELGIDDIELETNNED